MRWRLFKGELVAVGALAVAAVIASMVWRPTDPFKGEPLEPARPVPAFTLVDQHGRPFSSDALKGKVVAVFFGYTHCPDVCPATLNLFALARRQLADAPESEAVRFVFISVDPERDTPQRLEEYLQAIDPGIIGLTGTPPQVREVLEAWGVTAEKVPLSANDPTTYTMTHTASVLLLDETGRIRVRVPFGSSADDLVHDIRELLRR